MQGGDVLSANTEVGVEFLRIHALGITLPLLVLSPHKKAEPTAQWLGFKAQEHGPPGVSSFLKHMETIPFQKVFMVSLLRVSVFQLQL